VSEECVGSKSVGSGHFVRTVS